MVVRGSFVKLKKGPVESLLIVEQRPCKPSLQTTGRGETLGTLPSHFVLTLGGN